MTRYAWLMLDADGTLFDFRRAERFALDEIQQRLGLEPSEEVREIYHAINATLWKEFEAGILNARQVRDRRFEDLLKKLDIVGDSRVLSEAFLGDLVRETRFLDGAQALLERFKHKIGLVLLTNGFADVQRARIARLGLEDTFDHVVISEEIGIAKPDCAIFETALKRMGHPDKHSVLIVGDSLSSDIAGGSRVGIDTCWFNPEHHPNETGVEPTYEISHLSELAERLIPGRG
jgi:2-haloacid dehalogenase